MQNERKCFIQISIYGLIPVSGTQIATYTELDFYAVLGSTLPSFIQCKVVCYGQDYP